MSPRLEQQSIAAENPSNRGYWYYFQAALERGLGRIEAHEGSVCLYP